MESQVIYISAQKLAIVIGKRNIEDVATFHKVVFEKMEANSKSRNKPDKMHIKKFLARSKDIYSVLTSRVKFLSLFIFMIVLG